MNSRDRPSSTRWVAVACFVFSLMSCVVPTPQDAGPTCEVVAPEACGNPSLRFSDVQPLFDTHCTNCHYGELGGPWPLKSYMDVADWASIVRDDLIDCSMPPPMPARR